MASDNSEKQTFFEHKFSLVFEKYAVGLLVYARQFVGSKEIAEDMVHDVFMNLWEKRKNVDFATADKYLFRATRNACLNYLTHLKTRTKYQNEILQQKELPDSLGTEFYVYSELESRIQAAIDKLPEMRRKAFIMSRIEMKTYAQIGQELGLSPRTVDKHIELAVRSLRKDLYEYLGAIVLLYFPTTLF